ncbi:hypothetical protein BDN72DRAFT_503409 [Pluteus cervinus]|uniref:Uncharacterized protein n=1 Tax=Pluteus cervinus TaxID=181527 RepID=A0ACD3AZS6_9AGAR|nr:hypothetical protein BDN72DRAFT_503409 [Pluteus cervinus]
MLLVTLPKRCIPASRSCRTSEVMSWISPAGRVGCTPMTRLKRTSRRLSRLMGDVGREIVLVDVDEESLDVDAVGWDARGLEGEGGSSRYHRDFANFKRIESLKALPCEITRELRLGQRGSEEDVDLISCLKKVSFKIGIRDPPKSSVTLPPAPAPGPVPGRSRGGNGGHIQLESVMHKLVSVGNNLKQSISASVDILGWTRVSFSSLIESGDRMRRARKGTWGAGTEWKS